MGFEHLRAAAALCLLAWLAHPLSAGAAEARRTFDRWMAVCRDDGGGACSAATVVKDDRDPRVRYAFQLRVVQPPNGGPLDLSFMPTFDYPAPDSPMELRIDALPPVSLAPDAGYRPLWTLNDYRLVDPAVTARTIEAMRAGRSLRVAYRSADGRPVETQFSLVGFTQALEFIDRTQSGRRADPAVGLPDTRLPTEFACQGREPEWRLDVAGAEARYGEAVGDSGRSERRFSGAYRWLDYL